MKNIFLLNTNGPSKLYHHSNGELQLRSNIPRSDEYLGSNQHMYIVSDEQIKDGDWVYRDSEIVFKITQELLDYYEFRKEEDIHKRYKIILTTDQDLIEEGIQSINNEFLEWYIQNPKCEFVKLELKEKSIPIIQPDGDILKHKYKSYQIITPKDVSKQDTLKEAAEKYSNTVVRDNSKIDFIAGATYQAERMYSEEEVKLILDKTLIEYSDIVLSDIPDWFTQFKKKQ